MALTLEELVLKLRADVDDFKAKLADANKAQKDSTDKIKASTEELSNPFKKVTSLIGGFQGALVAAGVAGVGVFVKHSLDSANALYDLAENTQISTSTIQSLGFAARQTGLDQEVMNQSLIKFSKNIGDAVTGNETAKNSFAALGISLNELRTKSPDQVLNLVADSVKKLGNSAEQNSVLTDMFGRSGGKMIQIFRDGAAGLSAFQSEAKSLGLILDDAMIKKAADANNKLDVLSDVIGMQLKTAVIEFAPELQKLTTQLVEVAKLAVGAGRAFAIAFDPLGTSHVSQVRNASIAVERLTREIERANGNTKVAPELVERWKTQLADAKNTLASLTGQTEEHAASVNKSTGAIAANKKAQEELKKLKEEGEKVSNEADPTTKYRRDMKALVAYYNGAAGKEEEFQERKVAITRAKDDELEKMRMVEVQKLLERNELLKEIDSQKYADDIAANQEKLNSILLQEEANSTMVLSVRKRQHDAEAQLRGLQLNAVGTFFGGLSQLAAAGGKDTFELSKRLAQAQAVMSGAVAINYALANPPGPPFNAFIVAGVAASTIAQVATIEGTHLKSGIDSVPGIGTEDNFPAVLAPRERVLSAPQNKGLDNFMSSQARVPELLGKLIQLVGSQQGGGNISVQIQGREVFNAVQNEIKKGRRLAA